MVPLLVAITLVAATISSAQARDGHHPLGGSVATSTEPGGATQVTSGAYDNDIKSADLFFNSDTMPAELYQGMVFGLLSAKTKSRRIVGCALMSSRYMAHTRDYLLDSTLSNEEIEAVAGSRAAGLALFCMNLVRLMAEIEAEGTPTRVAARRSTCDVLPVQVKYRTERTEDGQYRIVPRGKFTDGTKALQVRLSCTGRGTRTTMHVVPKKKKVPLRKVAGKQISVAVANPSTASENADITVGFKGR
jgi:hypothetical protein